MRPEPAMMPRKTQCGEGLRSPAAPAEVDDITVPAQCAIYCWSPTVCVCVWVWVAVWVCEIATRTETPAIK